MGDGGGIGRALEGMIGFRLLFAEPDGIDRTAQDIGFFSRGGAIASLGLRPFDGREAVEIDGGAVMVLAVERPEHQLFRLTMLTEGKSLSCPHQHAVIAVGYHSRIEAFPWLVAWPQIGGQDQRSVKEGHQPLIVRHGLGMDRHRQGQADHITGFERCEHEITLLRFGLHQFAIDRQLRRDTP